MQQGFATCDHNDRRICCFSFCNQVSRMALGMAMGIPRMFGITPGATHVAACQANKESICTCPRSLTLNGVEGFHHWQDCRGCFSG
ncbi:hypothetical protein GEI7407_2812 [Geitlerinema sp. PCC 7407]|nr:hypothetical protein GEI7407_2812 [Geitlerinema sp. PCC 7407]